MGINHIVVNPSLPHLSFPLPSYLFAAAYFGTKVYARGIVEFSNVCTKDCFYCGIRKHTVRVGPIMEQERRTHWRHGDCNLSKAQRSSPDPPSRSPWPRITRRRYTATR